MTVNEVYELMQYIINKNQNGALSPSRFNSVINAAQNSYVAYLLGEYRGYKSNRQIAPVEFGQNARIRESLTPLIKLHVPLTLTPVQPGDWGAGDANYPSDYLAFDAMYYGGDTKRVPIVEQDRLSAYINSVIDPYYQNPFVRLFDKGFRLYPGTHQYYLSYIKKPPKIEWGYSIDPTTGRATYNAGASSNPVWRDTDMMQIIVRALAMVGVNLKDADVSQYSAMIKNMGQ